MALGPGNSQRWWDEDLPGGGGPEPSGPSDGVDDGLAFFVAAATATRPPAREFEHDDEPGGRRTGAGGVRSANPGYLRELTAALPARRVLVLLAAAVGVVALLVVLLAGGGGPAAEPALPVAGSPGEVLGDVGAEAGVPDDAGRAEAAGGTAGAAPGDGLEVAVVHVAGAVERPGVHLLPVGSRVNDAIAAAGGPRPEADLDRLNLAAPVADGAQVFVAALGDAGGGAGTGMGAPPDAGGARGASPANSPVSLSTADAAALDALPGVGPSTAAAIIAHREANGPFSSVDELLEVRGIGSAKLEGLRDLVVP